MSKWNINDIKKSKVAHLNSHLVNWSNSTNLKPSPQKEWLELNLQYWANDRCVELVTEYKFHDVRKWRFDWAFPALKVAVEYNGIMSKKSRHTTITGYSKDMEKINAAQRLGWKVLQYTPLNFKNVINDLNIMCIAQILLLAVVNIFKDNFAIKNYIITFV